jgi:class 3 adenylate cyclase
MPNPSDSERVLTLLKGKRIHAGILYVDIVGSTKTVSSLDPSQVKVYYRSFVNEMTRVVRDLAGYVLKYVGDAVIGFFPSSNGFVNEADHTALCGLVMIEVCRATLSPYLQSKGLPEIACRVGADFGPVDVVALAVTGAYLCVDLVGNVMNIAAKIQAKAGPNQYFIGDQLFKLAHTSYRTQCTRIGELQLPNLNYPYYHLDMNLI